MTEPAYLFLDPGDTFGWATFSSAGDIIAMGQFHMRDAPKELDKLVQPGLTKCVCERWRNRPGKMQHWGTNQTSRNIGKVELMCQMRDVELEFVEPAEMAVGYAWMGMEQPKNHSISHQWDATAHGVCWLQKNDINEAGKFLKGKT